VIYHGPVTNWPQRIGSCTAELEFRLRGLILSPMTLLRVIKGEFLRKCKCPVNQNYGTRIEGKKEKSSMYWRPEHLIYTLPATLSRAHQHPSFHAPPSRARGVSPSSI